jgi:GTP cyclohydrolase II
MKNVEVITSVKIELDRCGSNSGIAVFHAFSGFSDRKEHIAVTFGEFEKQDALLVRIHSECGSPAPSSKA